MNQLTKVFNGHELRIIEKDNEIWFVAKDVADILGFSETAAMTKHLDDDEKVTVDPSYLAGSNIKVGSKARMITLINESGLYSAILRSRKPEAKQFKRWITHEVIPSIRKHGAYMTPETIEKALLNPDVIINLATKLKEEQEKRQQLEAKIKQDEPYTNFGKAIASSEASITIGSFAKLLYDEHGIEIGRNRLFEWLRNNGYLIKSGREKNQPKQQYVEQGLFETTVTLKRGPKGYFEFVTTLITGKGQVEITKKLLKEFVVEL